MPSGLNQPSSEIEPIVGIQFGIFSPEEIERRSVVEITNFGTFDGSEPRIGGLFDPRMGVLDNGKTCRSCGQTNHNCPGHFGHYKLARPVYYIQFFPTIMNIMNCICIRCSKLLIDKELNKNVLKKRGEARWRAVLTACANISRCGQDTEDGCGALQPSRYLREAIARIVAEWDNMDVTAKDEKKQRQVLECEYVLRLFRRITDEDVDFMGFNRYWCRPDWMICSILPIPPPQVRPSVIQDNNQRSEDDLTHKLFEIIQTNNTVQDKINNNAAKNIIDDQYAVLQYHVATLVDNQIPGVAPSAQRSGRPLKSIQQRLGSKEGRIRYNIQGKRVEFSGRSVITPDPNISIEEIGVPTKIAMNLTVPERVTTFNRNKLYKLIQNGSDVYPGAKTIIRKDGRMISLKHVNTKEIVLQYGDIVNRHLMDGDPILFNRQPTLHRMSMMGHKVKVLPFNTFRLNVSVTSPYNADFDGDEMNMHCPQSYEASIELAEIAAVSKQIITPRHAKPVIGIVQDTLIGSYRLTQPNVNFTRREFMNMMMWNMHYDGTLPTPKKNGEVERYTGQQVLSEIIPPLNMEMGNSRYNDEKIPDNFIKIQEGVVEQGIFDKDVFSKPSKGIIHTTFKDYGPRETVHFLDCMQSTIEQFLIYNGFSVGISDLIADEKTKNDMNDKIRDRKAEVENIILQLHLDLFTNNTGKTNKQEFEDRVFTALNKATEESGKIGLASLAAENRLVSMVRAGSKGSTINIAQMLACVGQQAPEGRRIPLGFNDRTLPHYKKYDDGAEARGFVESSFIKGLSPQEFFFHAMSGREGLIDTAVKSVTGDTPIIIIENGEAKRVEIGPWIDTQLKANSKDVEQYDASQANLELLNITNEVSIPTVDAHGNMSWGKITAITRHDPGAKIYEIKTYGGRDVIVSAGKSLLVYDSKTMTFGPKPTPEVKVGDYVPTTVKLPAPPVIQTKVHLSKYLPKHKYIYGSDFIDAHNMMNAAMGNERIQIPRGWWEKNNGTSFTLPYISKALFQRTLVRSELSTIESGYLYPFHASREVSKTSEIFELNSENGIFIGLFLAEGNVDVGSGYVQITNNDVKIREFTKAWFEKNNMNTSENIKTNNIGTSSCIRGFSSIFAQFLDAFVGHGAEHKYVPSEAFVAPEEFIIGILNGYFSGDGTVSSNSINSSSASKRLTTGISLLCNRLGIFGRMTTYQYKTNNFGTLNILPTYRFDIRSKWAQIFALKVPMIHDEKQKKLDTLSTSLEHRNFPAQNDIVLDTISEINELSPNSYPKLYDLTIPENFTFMIENGHNCYDTADTGYIQRQLVKAMEDCVTQNDGTVRDAKMNIVQFHYGEDGTNSTMIESQSLALGKFSTDEIKQEYGLVGVSLEDILDVVREDDVDLLNNFVDEVLNDQKIMVENVNKFKDVTNSSAVYSPVNIERAMNNIRISFKLSKENKTDLTPTHVINGINTIIHKTQTYNKIWAALLRYNLAPHKIIGRDRFSVKAFDTLCEVLIVKNFQSWAQPGEQVGIIAAQSIGEPSTQMSTSYDTIVVINSTHTKYVGKIGEFIDGLLEKHEGLTIGPDSVVLDLNEEYSIIGVSNDEKTSWRKISQVSRHPANGGLVEITTKSGRKTTATLTHSFLTRSTTGVVPILGSELMVGTRVPIARVIPEVPNPLMEMNGFQLTKEFGWLCGMYLADGSLSGNIVSISKIHPRVEEKIREIASKYDWEISIRNYEGAYGQTKSTNIHCAELKHFLLKHFSTGSYGKTIDGAIYHSNKAYISGLLGGYFDGDGNMNVERQQIRVGSRSKDLIHHIARLLAYCGIFGSFGEEMTRVSDKILYTYQVLKKFAATFKEIIGLELSEKAAGLDAIITYMERDGKHDTKELYDKIPEVGDIIGETGKLLDMPGHSRNYGRWSKKESVGRLTLQGYIKDFEEQKSIDPRVISNIEILRAAAYCDVLWDEIVELKYIDDPKTYVYDFTVPGNDSFMVDDSIIVHNTLNTFHLAGVASKSNVTRGVPRLKELLKVTQNPKAISLTIPLKKKYRESIEKARQVAQDLELTLLKDIVTKTAIYFDPKEDILEEDNDIITFFNQFEKSKLDASKWGKWLLRLEFDHDAMFNKNISMDDVAYALEQKFTNEISMVYSDYNSDKLIMRIRLAKDTKIQNTDDILNLKKMQNRLLNLIIIRGIQGIKSVSYRKDTNYYEMINGKYEQITQYILDTDGSNFLEIMNHPYVYGNGVLSSHVHDIYENLGIEAARATLLNEITNLFADAGGVDFRHLGLLCDWMTRVGKLLSVDRYGINKQDIGPLAKASFEETEKILLKAALYGEVDPITGVSANIMTGQPIRGGTGFSEILLDEAALMILQEGLPDIEEEEEEEYEATQQNIDDETYQDPNDRCAMTNLSMNVVMPKDTLVYEEPDVELTTLEN